MKYILTLSCILVLGVFFTRACYADVTDQLTFSSNDFTVDTVSAADSNYYEIVQSSLAHQSNVGDAGDPDLPTFIYLYCLSSGDKIDSITITSKDSVKLADLAYDILPLQEEQKTCIDCSTSAFSAKSNWYDSTYFPSTQEITKINNPLQFCMGMAMGSIKVNPIIYDIADDELWLITSLSFTIHTSSSGKSPVTVTQRSEFVQDIIEDYLKGLVENPNSVTGNLPNVPTYTYNNPTDPDDIPPDYIIITTEDYEAEMSALKYIKEIEGHPVEIKTVEDIETEYSGTDTPDEIRMYIKDRYEEGAYWVILMGNKDVVPIRYAWDYNHSPDLGDMPTDLYYACLEGDWDLNSNDVYGEYNDSIDIAADILVGRIAISDDSTGTGQTNTWVEKLIQYVKAPGNGSTAYLNDAIISAADQMADNNRHGYIANGFDDWFNVDIETLVEDDPYGPSPTQPTGENVVDELSDPTYQMYISLNHGSPCWFAVRTAYNNQNPRSGYTTDPVRGDYTDWGYVGDVTNGYNHYIHCSIACDIGMLDSEDIYGTFYGDCIAEDELTMEGGSFAGTYNTRYGWPNGSSYMERNRVDLLTQTNNFGHCFGRVHYAIKSLQDYDSYLDIILDNTLFSDPEFSIYVEYPRSFSVTFPSSVSVFELDTLTVTVKDSATQVSITDAFVTLSKGNEIYERDMSDYAGKTYPVTEPSTTGWIYITVTKPGYTLFVDSIEVVPYCADAVAGDANGDGYVIGSDVSFLSNYFRGLVTPPDSCQCPTNFLYHAADANGDCSVIGSDVTYLLNYFSGGSAPHFCTNCPTGGALLSNLKVIPTERVNSMLNKNSKLNQNDNISPFIKTRENDAARQTDNKISK